MSSKKLLRRVRRTDQYGKRVDVSRLVLLPDIDDLTDEEIMIVDAADWYEFDRCWLVAPFYQLKGLSEDDPVDAGVDLLTSEFLRVDHVLHRWRRKDGFFHA